MKVIIDPEDDIQYMSFYIKGLGDRFGQRNLTFNHHAFDDLPIEERHTRTMRFIIKHGASEMRYVIDANDSYKVNGVLYDWSDLYGSVNANFEKTPSRLQTKLVSLCPSFAIRYANALKGCACAVKGVVTTRRNKRKYLGCWKRMLQRPVLSDYCYQQPEERYVFHLSTLWLSDEWNRNDEGVNYRRAQFIKACKALEPEIVFEGGLVASGTVKESSIFVDCLSQRYKSDKWMKLTKASAIVFNTPAYWDCHGWKLGEFMAMGKAMLSTPLFNDLPSPLVNGEHIHFIEDFSVESIKENVDWMVKHRSYCEKLEHNILQYWLNYGTPLASLKLMGIA